jgi:tetratricopeptide (TPR) repeat protein
MSYVPWWDKIGVNTAMKFKVAQNWRHPAMTDEEIEELVQQMPTEFELAGLSSQEREAYLRARYKTLQMDIARSRSMRKRSPHTFEPVLYNASWEADAMNETPFFRPKDAPTYGIRKEDVEIEESIGDMVHMDYESLPHQPFGPRLPPPPLPEISYWKQRKNLERLSKTDTVLSKLMEWQMGTVSKLEEEFERNHPWFSSNESERVKAEKQLRMDPKSRQKVAKSIEGVRKLRRMRRETLAVIDSRFAISVKAQGGHERLAWHQITADEWKEMSEVEFSYWRYRIAADWMKANKVKEEDETLHAGTVTIALRKSLQDWQTALYAYEKAKRPVHMTPNDLSIWNYELTKSEWFKAGRALETRLLDVERRSTLHRRYTVLNYLGLAFSDWVSYYKTALENANVLEKWGLEEIAKSVPKVDESSSSILHTESELSRYREKLKFEWTHAISSIMQGLQNQKEIGPFPFDVPLEKIDQHIIDKIYARLMIEEDMGLKVSQKRLFSKVSDLPPMPAELKLILTNPISMLVSSGNDAESGLFGPKLAEKRREEEKVGKAKTLSEIDRRTHLMLTYWHDHNIREVEVDGKKYAVPESDEKKQGTEKMDFAVVERLYFELLDQGVDVHGLYEKPQWETDEAGRYRASKLSPFEVPPSEPVSLPFLHAGGSELAIGLLNDLITLAFPISKDSIDVLPLSVPILDRAKEAIDWSGLLSPITGVKKERDLAELKRIASSGLPQVVREEREASFFSVEQEPIDPHPQLWQRLLILVWKMRIPPGWLVTRLPETYGDWKGITEADMTNGLGTLVDDSRNLIDTRNYALENPRRKAWELSKRAKEYKSLLLGATLTDNQARTLERVVKASEHMKSITSGKQIVVEEESEFVDPDAAERLKMENQRARFERLKRDVIAPEETVAAKWLTEFDINAFSRSIGGFLSISFNFSKELAQFTARFTDSYLMTVKEFTKVPDSMKSLQNRLDTILEEINPQEARELGIELFHRREKIQKAFVGGMPKSSTAIMMNYYLAYALRSKIELVLKTREASPTLETWVAQFVSPTSKDGSEDHLPRTLIATVYQLARFPFRLLRNIFLSSNGGSVPTSAIYSDHTTVGSAETEKKRAQLLVDLTRHLEAMNAIQPWRMWSKQPWTWRSSLLDHSRTQADRKEYEKAMNFPRRMFWDTQRSLWDQYMDNNLEIFHQLMIEQRMRQGIPTNRGEEIVDGTLASQQYWLGESLLNQGHYKDALDCYKLSARYGSLEALFTLGKLHSQDIYNIISPGLPEAEILTQPSLEYKSRDYLEEAARKGHEGATGRLLDQCLMPPEGAEPDVIRAKVCLRIAVEEYNSVTARLGLAALYERGSQEDIHKAIELYRSVPTPESHDKAKQLTIKVSKRDFVDAGHLKDSL